MTTPTIPHPPDPKGDDLARHVQSLAKDLSRLEVLVQNARASLEPLSQGSTAEQVALAATSTWASLWQVAIVQLTVSGKLGRLEALHGQGGPTDG